MISFFKRLTDDQGGYEIVEDYGDYRGQHAVSEQQDVYQAWLAAHLAADPEFVVPVVAYVPPPPYVPPPISAEHAADYAALFAVWQTTGLALPDPPTDVECMASLKAWVAGGSTGEERDARLATSIELNYLRTVIDRHGGNWDEALRWLAENTP